MSNYDYWASHSFFGSSQVSEKAAVDYLLKGGKNPYPHHIPDLSARVALSALALLGDKEYARAGTRREAGGLSQLYQQQSLQDYLHERLAQYRNLLESPPDLSHLPAGSFTISFNFTLSSPYLSKDDTALHLLDNPVKKEWVFKLPYVASTQWKGTLQATMVRQLVEWWRGLSQMQQQQRTQRKQFVARRIQLTRLFGTEIENTQHYLARCGDDKLDKWYKRYVRRFLSDTGFLAGRLYLYPTFFDQLSLEVINPHNRETGAGSLPIYFEAVPIKATGTFTLLYVPLDSLGEGEVEIRRQTLADLQRVAEGLEALFTLYGFGAKTSSGFGLAGDVVDNGRLALKLPEVTFPQDDAPKAQKPDDEYRKYLDESGRVNPAFEGSGEGGLLSNSEYKKTGTQQGGGTLSEFKSFRRWYGEHGAQWQTSLQRGATKTDYPESSFESLSHLTALCQNLEAESDATRGGDA